ncbi:MAG: hypothetical protein LKM43_03580 [Wolbachia endosymbiont of Penenirmus auritus]|nr:hypothetical protein [Wolbachia endosymbiont of Penenirmus auritus]
MNYLILENMSLEKLQHKLIEKIYNITIESNDDIVKNEKERALEIINKLKDHINDDIEINDNLKMTVLDCIIRCDSQGNARLNNRSLIDLEKAVKKIGGKTSQELGREQNVEELQDIDIERIRSYLENVIQLNETYIGLAEQIESSVERQRKLCEDLKKYTQIPTDQKVLLCLMLGVLGTVIGVGLADTFGNNIVVGGVLGASVGVLIAGTFLWWLSKKNSASTNLDKTTIEQHTQGTEPTLSA